MEVGPRIATIMIIVAIWQGLKEGNGLDLEAIYQTILATTAVNWCLRPITETLEERIMRIVNAMEARLLAWWLIFWGGLTACLWGTMAWLRGTSFPPVIDV